jgi:hypothetical protein
MTWTFAYAHDKNGNAVRGSLQELADAIRNGAPARVRIDYAVEGPPIYRDIAALWIKDGHVYAQSSPVVSAAFQAVYVNGDTATVSADFEADGLRFLDNPYYYFEICSTRGDVDKSRWGIADNKLRRRNQGKFAIEWFVQK